MSRPKVIDHEHDTVWTEAYVDSAVSMSQLIGVKLCDDLWPVSPYVWFMCVTASMCSVK